MQLRDYNMLILLLIIGYVIGIIGTQVVMRCCEIDGSIKDPLIVFGTMWWPIAILGLLVWILAKYVMVPASNFLLKKFCPNKD